jgi:hypothetical protein
VAEVLHGNMSNLILKDWNEAFVFAEPRFYRFHGL